MEDPMQAMFDFSGVMGRWSVNFPQNTMTQKELDVAYLGWTYFSDIRKHITDFSWS